MLKGISRRWFFTIFCFIAAIVVAISSIFVYFMGSYYYRYVEVALDSHASDLVNTYFSTYSDGSDDSFAAAAIDYAEEFSDKALMEVWVLDRGGQPIVSSSGFEIPSDIDIPDYDLAVRSESDKATWRGRLPNGEKIMAVTGMLNSQGGSGAVRYMCSLADVDAQIVKIALIAGGISAIVILFVLFSGLYFVRSIVIPVREINSTAKKLAAGDLSARVHTGEMKDEIDELGATFNSMAQALAGAESLKNDFISTISHELRTPLTSIKGWGETLAQINDSDPETLRKGIGVIIGESQRLSGMVEELLDFSRMQNGRMQLIFSRIDVLAELDDTVFAFKDRAAREGLELIYNVPHYPIPMNGDPDRIRQVFTNLLDNAFKYNEHGGKVIVLAEPGDKELTIYFTDTGCGISEEDLPRVTDKFYRANMSVRGTGIGLAVAKEIVEMHYGTLEVSSVLGEGTTVTVKLPVENNEYSQERNGENEEG